MQWVLLIGMIVLSNTGSTTVLTIGVALFATTTAFSFITLPVEIDASRRAVEWLEKARMVDGATRGASVDALRAAAYTYVVAALSSLATLLYYLWMLLGSRNRD